MFTKCMRTRRLRRGGQPFWQRLTGKRVPAQLPVTHVMNKAYDSEGKIAELNLKFEQFREMILKAFKLTDVKVQATQSTEKVKITELFRQHAELERYTRSSISHLGRLVQSELGKLKPSQPAPELRRIVGEFVGPLLDELSSKIEDAININDERYEEIMNYFREMNEELRLSHERYKLLATKMGIQTEGGRR